MSEDNKGSGGAPDNSTSGDNQEASTSQGSGGTENQVAYETYKKTLDEAKKAKARVEEMQSKLQKIEQEKLQAEGNKDELISKLREENDSLNGKLSGAVKSFAKSKVESAVIAEASRLGCQDTQLLVRAYMDDIEGIDFDDSFDPDSGQVKALVEKIRGEKKFLFNKEAPRTANHQIKTVQDEDLKGKPLTKLKDEELMAIWAKNS